MPQCNVCTQPKSHYWFLRTDGSYRQPCHGCECIAQKFAQWTTPAEMEPIRIPTTSPRRCSSCIQLGHKCRVCLLIEDFRSKQPQPVVAETNVIPIRRFEDIPLRGVEKIKVEKYIIVCTRCKSKCDPSVDVIVGAVCSECWLPEERQSRMREHHLWNKKPKALKVM